MSYSVSQGDIFGRLGSAFGQGVNEALPKIVERKQLQKGLSDFEKDSGNLSPIQTLARLSSIPGITPQMIQSFGELAKQQSMRAGIKSRGRGQDELTAGGSSNTAQALGNIPFGGNQFQNQGTVNKSGRNGQENLPSDFPSEQSKATDQPGINDRGAVRQEVLPAKPWTLDRRDQELEKLSDQFPQATLPELQKMASDNEARELSRPVAEQAIDEFLNTKKAEADDSFTKQLELKLQKKGEKTFDDVPGELQSQLRKGMYRDISAGMPTDKAADKWTEIALNQGKANSQVEKLAGQSLIDSLNKEKTLSSLQAAQKVYAKGGNSEAFYNKIREKFGLSPQGAALIAYPRTPQLKSFIQNSRPPSGGPEKNAEYARKTAQNISKLLTPQDSLLAVAREMRDRNPFFDERSFFDQLREDLDDLSLTPRQRRELIEGESSLIRSWGDVWMFPSTGRSKAND